LSTLKIAELFSFSSTLDCLLLKAHFFTSGFFMGFSRSFYGQSRIMLLENKSQSG
jgi:hypothetical protein